MKELKTLKDTINFDERISHINGLDSAIRIINQIEEDLRQEAIKWAKRYRELEELDYYRGAIQFIKTFFNAKEEEIK